MSQNYIIVNGELYHHGVKGQKWGIRRYQNKDGSLTPAGKKRMKVFQDAASRAADSKKFADSEYKRFTKLAEEEEAKKGKPVSQKEINAYLREQFGNDIDSEDGRAYIREVEAIDDLDAYAREQLRGGDAEHFRNVARNAKEVGEAYVRLNKKFSSMTVNDIDRKTLKQAKSFVNKLYIGVNDIGLAQLKAYELDSREWTKDKWLEYTRKSRK